MADIQKPALEELAEDGTGSGVEFIEDETIEEPFNPDSISIEPKVVSMDSVLRRLRQGTIKLDPTFQRKFVWDLARCSRLIESLMLRIPLPMFYVAANEKGEWDVVDGLQRLTAIRNFIIGKKLDDKGTPLRGLEFLGEKFNGKTFKQIENDSHCSLIVNNIMETEMRFTVINPGTPEIVKRNIFKRINTGGMPLSHQEIRHALYQGKATVLLGNLVNSSEFKGAIFGTVNDSRMAAQELVLRFLAFSVRKPESFSSDMDKFLSDTMRIINILPELEENKLQKIFKPEEVPQLLITSTDVLSERFFLAMSRAKKLFGEYAFRKSIPGYHRTPINKSLFDSWPNILADMPEEEFSTLLKEKTNLIVLYRKLLFNSFDFEKAIGRDGSKSKGIQYRFAKLRKLIQETLQGL